ncbi:zona pellucida-like domain protein [Ancylostoma caninum]|uniref:Zona pellucida-like domain protein n=1 Tax=Ancylostoma caninum TaxID=29170 RepID=A0A368FT59_ANCCA|nr:zona pellucida-like domain protein [Ancylostoma caninum]
MITLIECYFHVSSVLSISIDNDIVGEPDIECLDEEIRIWVKTRKPFGGRIYAKGKAEVEECYKDDFARERTKKPHFDLKFGVCGMRSLRSVDPRGMYYGITIVVSFHPLFITKVDQAFHVKCFFEEASRGLTAELGVRCPVDPILITGIRYSADLQRAYAESSVFKFADKPGVWFFCQIQMCMKKAGMCHGITPPSCASTAPPVAGEGEEPTETIGPAEVPEVDYEETTIVPRRKTTVPPDYAEPTRRRTTAEYPEYSDETKELKLHSPVSPVPYGRTTPSADYDLQTEAVTIFGPAFSSEESEREAKTGTRVTTTSVSQSFETEEDLLVTTPIPKKSTKIGKSDYNDYDDVTIPPNLTDLLANLPDDLSPETLQKMFRHKLGRRPTRMMRELRAGDLRSGDKIDQIQVDWMAGRRRDAPIPDDRPVVATTRSTDDSSSSGRPMISGQLMIFELDEEPPEFEGRMKTKLGFDSAQSACAISRSGLFAVAGGLGAVCAALFIAVLTMFLKLSRIDGKSSDSSDYSQNADRITVFRPRQRNCS